MSKACFSPATEAQAQAQERLYHREDGPDAAISACATDKNFPFSCACAGVLCLCLCYVGFHLE